MKKFKPSRNTHAPKTRQERQAYGRFILSTKGKRLEDTASAQVGDGDAEGVSDTADIDATNRDARLLPNAPTAKKKRTRPYKSLGTQIKENWVAAVAGAVLLVLLGTAVTVLWTLNREVGVMTMQVDELQKKYDGIFTTSDGNHLDMVQIKVQVEKDLEYIRERLERIELRVFR